MIRLKPNPDIRRKCPYCRSELEVTSWLIPGMRNLAELECRKCRAEFYADLPSGQGLYTPLLLEKSSGRVYDDYDVKWFSRWLSDSYAARTTEKLDFKVRKFCEIKHTVVLLNCLDTLYGHSLLKLLNAQYYLERTDISLIILIPSFLEWMIPDGAAEAWIIDLPLRRGTEWNDWLANKLADQLADFEEVFLSTGFSHPHPGDFEIEKFTKVKPFPLANWADFLEKPCVTFIWRDDRLWETEENKTSGRFGKIKSLFRKRPKEIGQLQNVIDFAETLRSKIPALDFAVAGIGEANNLPGWISDLRLRKINDAAAEQKWCARYAQSHIVVGVHGSNMLLPSAHAGAVIELIGEDRWENFLQDILVRPSDVRETLFRYRFVPLSATADELARLSSLILRYEEFRQLMSPEFCGHRENYDLSAVQSLGVKEK